MLFAENYSQCKIRDSVVVSGEKGKCHRVENKSGYPIYQYHIDKGIICDKNTKRCDYIVEVTKDTPIAFIIELKGCNINKAIQQIESTINHFKSKLQKYDIRPRIISNGVTHSIYNSEFRKFQYKYRQAICRSRKYTDIV